MELRRGSRAKCEDQARSVIIPWREGVLKTVSAVLLSLQSAYKPPGILLKHMSSSPGVGWSLTIYISERLPGDADAACLQPLLRLEMMTMYLRSDSYKYIPNPGVLRPDGFSETLCFLEHPVSALSQQSPTILVPGTGFVEDTVSMDRVQAGGMVQAVLGLMGSGRGSFTPSPPAVQPSS